MRGNRQVFYLRITGDRPLAHRDVASAQKGADTQQQTILFLDESGFYPLPSVVRTYAPIGQTPILGEWWTRDHLSAISLRQRRGREGALSKSLADARGSPKLDRSNRDTTPDRKWERNCDCRSTGRLRG
jgi:hypothetical protein